MEYKDGNMANAGQPGNPPPYSGAVPGQPPVVGVVGVVGQPTTTIIHTNMPSVIPVVVGNQMSPKPQVTVCKSCNAQIETRVITKSTMKTHLFAALLCLVGCWPCVFIPYCMSSCKNADHYCPNCNSYLGSYLN